MRGVGSSSDNLFITRPKSTLEGNSSRPGFGFIPTSGSGDLDRWPCDGRVITALWTSSYLRGCAKDVALSGRCVKRWRKRGKLYVVVLVDKDSSVLPLSV